MKFGVRQIANVVFKAKTTQTIGGKTYKPGQPVLYIDTAKTSTIEGAATTVYATGGRGNTRLIAWEGQKTLTFTVEDALLSPISFAVLSGARLFKGASSGNVHFHQTTMAYVEKNIVKNGEGANATTTTQAIVNLTDALNSGEQIDSTAPVFVVITDSDGDLTGEIYSAQAVPFGENVTTNNAIKITDNDNDGKTQFTSTEVAKLAGKPVLVDYYVTKSAAKVSELQIDAENFAGFYYVEADTLFRDKATGQDLPANITFPNVKIQSNFTFSMAATGDPSTFTFTMDAFPGYTYFNKVKRVLCAIQVAEESSSAEETVKSVFPHQADFDIQESQYDSSPAVSNETINS